MWRVARLGVQVPTVRCPSRCPLVASLIALSLLENVNGIGSLQMLHDCRRHMRIFDMYQRFEPDFIFYCGPRDPFFLFN